MRAWVDGHLGVPRPVGRTITAGVITLAAWLLPGRDDRGRVQRHRRRDRRLILGVPLAGTIGVVTFITAYVPYIGAFVAGAFAVMIALGAEGTSTALIMLVIVLLANGLLQNILQPFAMGAALDLQSARGARRDDRRRLPDGDDRPRARGAAHVGGGAHQPGSVAGTRARGISRRGGRTDSVGSTDGVAAGPSRPGRASAPAPSRRRGRG